MPDEKPFAPSPAVFELIGALVDAAKPHIEKLGPGQRRLLELGIDLGAEKLRDVLKNPPKRKRASKSAPPVRSQRLDDLRLLGLTEGATPQDIRNAYHRAARSVHPDHGGSDKKMADLNAAFARLMGTG
jgi:DnaJ-domain-containing protein 1